METTTIQTSKSSSSSSFQGERLVLYFLSVIFNEELFEVNSLFYPLKNLSLTNKSIPSCVRVHIQNNFWFIAQQNYEFRWYSVQNIKCVTDTKDLPTSLKKIHFDCAFDDQVDDLPQKITHLEFGDAFQHPVDNLPQSITHQTFNFQFNEPVDHLPPNIRYLTFIFSRFNQSVDNLPQKITHLTFGNDFNKLVNNLPQSITITLY